MKNKADGSITFPDYEYNATGDYYYRISEKQSSNPAIAGMDYDESIYLVHVKLPIMRQEMHLQHRFRTL